MSVNVLNAQYVSPAKISQYERLSISAAGFAFLNVLGMLLTAKYSGTINDWGLFSYAFLFTPIVLAVTSFGASVYTLSPKSLKSVGIFSISCLMFLAAFLLVFLLVITLTFS